MSWLSTSGSVLDWVVALGLIASGAAIYSVSMSNMVAESVCAERVKAARDQASKGSHGYIWQ